MATPAAIQAELGNQMSAQIVRSIYVDETYDAHYVVGLVTAPGRSRWCQTTTAETAANQAAEIVAALIA